MILTTVEKEKVTSIRSSSFDEQEEENRRYSESLSHIERLKYLKLLIMNAYQMNGSEAPSWISPIHSVERE